MGLPLARGIKTLERWRDAARQASAALDRGHQTPGLRATAMTLLDGAQAAGIDTAGPPAAVSVPRALFADRFENPQSGRHTGWDVFPHGRFLMIEPAEKDQATRRTEIVVVLDFLANVEAKLRGAQP